MFEGAFGPEIGLMVSSNSISLTGCSRNGTGYCRSHGRGFLIAKPSMMVHHTMQWSHFRRFRKIRAIMFDVLCLSGGVEWKNRILWRKKFGPMWCRARIILVPLVDEAILFNCIHKSIISLLLQMGIGGVVVKVTWLRPCGTLPPFQLIVQVHIYAVDWQSCIFYIYLLIFSLEERS